MGIGLPLGVGALWPAWARSRIAASSAGSAGAGCATSGEDVGRVDPAASMLAMRPSRSTRIRSRSDVASRASSRALAALYRDALSRTSSRTRTAVRALALSLEAAWSTSAVDTSEIRAVGRCGGWSGRTWAALPSASLARAIGPGVCSTRIDQAANTPLVSRAACPHRSGAQRGDGVPRGVEDLQHGEVVTGGAVGDRSLDRLEGDHLAGGVVGRGLDARAAEVDADDDLRAHGFSSRSVSKTMSWGCVLLL